MRKAVLSIIFIFTLFPILSAQDISSVVLTIPESVLMGLEASQKDLLIADIKDTTQIKVSRESYGEVKRLAVSSDYICLQTSDAGTTQIKLLPLINDSKIVCVVKTVCGNACDSRIEFYTTKWMPIAQSDLFSAKNKDKKWFIKSDVDSNDEGLANAYAALDMAPLKMTLSPNNNDLILTYDIKNYLSEEDYKKIQPYLTNESKTFKWDKVSYK